MTADKTEMAAGLLQRQQKWLESYRPALRVSEQGYVVSVGDGISWITGLPTAAIDDVLLFEDGSRGLVFDLTQSSVGAVLLHATDQLTAGTGVTLSGRQLSLPVGDALLGRVIDPLGTPLDGEAAPKCDCYQRLLQASPGIVERDFVHQPLYSGCKVVDTLIPIGRGQRQLIVGDEGLGRSSLALDTVINQRGQQVHCVQLPGAGYGD